MSRKDIKRMTTQGLDRHIDCSPGFAGGKPRISGSRITVADIAIWHLRMGKSVDEICSEHDLAMADIHAALAYYFDHRDDIDRSIDDSDAFATSLRASTPSLLERKLKALRGE